MFRDPTQHILQEKYQVGVNKNQKQKISVHQQILLVEVDLMHNYMMHVLVLQLHMELDEHKNSVIVFHQLIIIMFHLIYHNIYQIQHHEKLHHLI